MSQTQKDPAAAVAVRLPGRGKAHIVDPLWRDHYWAETTYCGHPTAPLTEHSPIKDIDDTGLCRSCVRGQASTNRFA